MQPLGSRNRIALLGLSVGLVLADSSVVTLALPKILVQFDVKVSTLAWALISFNLALALAAVPAATLARRRPVGVFGVATIVFAAASVACAFSPTFGVLVGLRAVQGVAGAAVVVAALDLLSEATGADASAARIWALAGIVGASVGPAIGGILTQLFGW
jgi:MFS family permease